MSANSDVEAAKSGFLDNKIKAKPNEPFEKSNLFRLFAVILYVCLVSGIGFLLALYHFFFWDSSMPPVARVPGHEVY